MFIKETWVDKTKGCLIGDSGFYEPFTSNLGELFRSLQKEYGRCTGYVYIGDDKPIGWVFEKKVKYTDVNEFYINETWVEVAACRTVKGVYILKYIDR